jgi:hypothetical protein
VTEQKSQNKNKNLALHRSNSLTNAKLGTNSSTIGFSFIEGGFDGFDSK